MNELNFTELLQGVQDAQEYLEMNTGKSLEELVNEHYGLHHETSPILGLDIDSDFQTMSRKELCNHIENKFDWENDSFWNLESTQKIRICCQVARNMQGEEDE